MAHFEIKDEELALLAGKVVVVTGGSSGIGLATIQLLLSLGASVVNGDVNPPPDEHDRLSFVKTNVVEWKDLIALFKNGNVLSDIHAAKEKHGRIDHVFANAGISGRADYFEQKLDDNGELLEPNSLTYDINLKGVINTSYLAVQYLRHQDPAGGSIVLIASASSFQRFRIVDYATAKHGVLGFMRGLVPQLQSNELPIRCNAVSPSWTQTGMVPEGVIEAVGFVSQTPEAVARSVVILMADATRQGQMIYSKGGEYWEIEESKLLKMVPEIVGEIGDDEALDRMYKMRTEMAWASR